MAVVRLIWQPSGVPTPRPAPQEARQRGRPCSIAAALQVVGEKWALLAVREISLGNHTFDAIARNTGATRDRLAARLRALEEAGVIERRQYSTRPPRSDYHLTAVGRDLSLVLQALRTWGDKWAVSEPPAAFHHGCGHAVDAALLCRHCNQEVSADDMHVHVLADGWDLSGVISTTATADHPAEPGRPVPLGGQPLGRSYGDAFQPRASAAGPDRGPGHRRLGRPTGSRLDRRPGDGDLAPTGCRHCLRHAARPGRRRVATADLSAPGLRRGAAPAGRWRPGGGVGQARLLSRSRDADADGVRVPSGGCRRAARSAGAAQADAGGGGAVRRRAQTPAAVPAGHGRAGLRSRISRRTRCLRARPPPLAGGAVRDPGGGGAGADSGRAGHCGAVRAGPGPGGRGDRDCPRRRLGGGPAAVLRRVAVSGSGRLPDARGLGRRPRAGHPAAGSGRRPTRVHPHGRRPARRTRRRRTSRRGGCGPTAVAPAAAPAAGGGGGRAGGPAALRRGHRRRRDLGSTIRWAAGRCRFRSESAVSPPERPPSAAVGEPQPEPAASYEQARRALEEVVRRLEAGGVTLEESLQLWERGEALADVCQAWLDGARARLATVIGDDGIVGGGPSEEARR